jgi:hypothetical protein
MHISSLCCLLCVCVCGNIVADIHGLIVWFSICHLTLSLSFVPSLFDMHPLFLHSAFHVGI